MENTELSLTTDLKLASTLVKSGLLPSAIKSPEAALVIILTGRELGLAPLQALRSISVVEGKPTLSADLLLALAYKSGLCTGYEILELTDEKCVVQISRNGQVKPPYSYTIEEARKAGLANRPNWTRHTKAMLRARATSAACRAYFPDGLLGLYTPDELEDLSPVVSEAAPVVIAPAPRVVEAAHAMQALPASPAPASPDVSQEEDREEAEVIAAVKKAISEKTDVAQLDLLGTQIASLPDVIKNASRAAFVARRKELLALESARFRDGGSTTNVSASTNASAPNTDVSTSLPTQTRDTV
jgi:hypothetical protein